MASAPNWTAPVIDSAISEELQLEVWLSLVLNGQGCDLAVQETGMSGLTGDFFEGLSGLHEVEVRIILCPDALLGQSRQRIAC